MDYRLERVCKRGGNWNNGTQNGVFALNLNNTRSNANNNIGSRPALPIKLKYYLRYMDDFVAICEDKWAAQETFYELQNYAEFKLGLKLNAKSGIFPLSKGLNFCGYRTWPTHRLPRKRNVRRMRRRIRALCKMLCSHKITKESVMQVWASFLGYMKHCDGQKTKVEIWREMNGILRKER